MMYCPAQSWTFGIAPQQAVAAATPSPSSQPSQPVSVPKPTGQAQVTIGKYRQVFTQPGGEQDYQSQTFPMPCATPALTAQYAFSGENLGINATVDGNGGADLQTLVQSQAGSGSGVSYVYPQAKKAGTRYYLMVSSSGPWSIVLTESCSPPGPSAVLTTKTFTGTGIWDSPEFTMACASPSVTAKVAFSGNTSGGVTEYFTATLQGLTGDFQQIADDNAASGQFTTTVQPAIQDFSGNKVYYLTVDAQGPWTVTLTQHC
jgi:hypothetical protein